MAKEITTAIGLRPGQLDWMTMRKTRNRCSAVNSGSIPVVTEEGEAVDLFTPGDPDIGPATALLRKKLGSTEGMISVAIPAEHVLLRVVELPTVEAEELPSMVEFQVDKFSPFPADSALTSFEVLEQGETSSRVLIAVVQQKTVAMLGELLMSAKVFPRRLDVETLCWLQLLRDADAIADTGCQVTMIKGDVTCEIVVTQDGMPVILRSLGRVDELLESELCAELDYTLTALEAEHGITAVDRLALWHSGEAPSGWVQAMQSDFGLAAQVQSLDTLPPCVEGLAKRDLLTSVARLDLAPAEWHAGEQRLHVRRTLAAVTVLMLCAWLAAVGALFGGIHWQKQQVANTQAKLDALTGPAREARAMRSLLILAEQYTNRTSSALECLREVTVHKPPQAIPFFKLFKYSGKDKKVIIQGEALQANGVLDFENALAGSALFTVADLDGPRRLPNGRQFFKITLDVSQGAP